jgi:soluble lytic murein transglycosylase
VAPLFLFLLINCFPFHANASIEAPNPLPLSLPNRATDVESYDLALKSLSCKNESCKLWSEFMRAKLFSDSKKASACEIYLKLSAIEDFELRPVSYIKASQVCGPVNAVQEKLLSAIDAYVKKEKLSRWLKASLTEALALIASEVSDEAFVTRALEAASTQKTKKAKIALLNQALIRAKKLSLQKILEVQTELSKISKLPIKSKLSPSDWFAVAGEAFINHDYELAEKGYKQVIKSGSIFTIRRTALDQLRQTYKIAQKKKQALATAEKLWHWDFENLKKQSTLDNQKRYVSSGLLLARMYWTEHKNKLARKTLSKLLKIKTTGLSDVYFILARMDEEEGKDDKALSELEETIKLSNIESGSLKSQYQWPYAWLSFKHKRFEQALPTLLTLSQTETETGKKSQATFWLAQTYKALGKDDQTKVALQKIITDDPLGFYTLLAYRDLKQPIPKVDMPLDKSQSGNTSISQLSKLNNVNWPLFRWLVATGEISYARQFLNEEVPVPDPAIIKDWKLIFSEYASIRYLSPLFAKINKLKSEDKLKILTEHREYLFPTPYSEIVNESATKSGLWPEYIFSIMRQESSFDADSISPANAYGLLQILPNVARQVGRAHGIKIKSNDDLLDPVINIPIGAYHLRSYLNKFNGQFILATAAYNASPETVKNWLAHRYHGDVLQFIEDIPFEETRTYVKLVLRNFINYQRINTQEPSIPFPEWCLQGF